MKKSEQTIEQILCAAETLILESGGDAERVTIRQIAERADVSVGLVNYYFTSKSRLIEACVQRMIGGVVRSFSPKLPEDCTRAERLGAVASQVAAYLEEHPQISRISILGDQNAPQAKDNTIGTAYGFAKTVSHDNADTDALLRAFCLTAILQSAFLRKEVLKESIGVDWNDLEQRDAFFQKVAVWLLSGQDSTK